MATKNIVNAHADGEYLHSAELENIIRAAGGAGVLAHSISATVAETDMDIILPAFDYFAPDGSGGKTFVSYAGATLTVSAADVTNPRNDALVGDAAGNVELRAGTPTAETGDVEDAPMVALADDEVLFGKVRVANGVTVIRAQDIYSRAIDVSESTQYRAGAGLAATAAVKIAYNTTTSALKVWDGSASVDASPATSLEAAAKAFIEDGAYKAFGFIGGAGPHGYSAYADGDKIGLGFIVDEVSSGSVNASSTLIGGFVIATGTTSGGAGRLVGPQMDTSQGWEIHGRVLIGSNDTNQTFVFGMGASDENHIIAIRKSGAGNLFLVCDDAGSETTVDLGIDGTTAVRLGIVNTGGTSVQAYVNGTATGSAITTNITASEKNCAVSIVTSTTADRAVHVSDIACWSGV